MKQALRTSKNNVHGIMKAVNAVVVDLNIEQNDRFVLTNNFSISGGYINILDTETSNEYGIEVFISKDEYVAVASMYRDEEDQEFVSTDGNIYTAADLY